MMRPNGFMLIVLVIALCRGFTSSLTEGKLNTEDAPSSEATPRILESRSTRIGKQCLTLPKISNPSVKALIEQKCYIDKTAYLDQLMRVGEKFYFLSRPRRLGKTLLVDTLQELFELGGDNKLFKDTEIYRRRDGVWSRYPTIRLDFSKGVVSSSVAAFNETTLKLINDQARNHEIDLGAPKYIEVAIKELIYRLNKKYNNASVVILIDEYDNPYTSAYPDMETASGILRSMQSFYKTLKAEYKTVHFNLVTGITRLALSNFFSGMNAATDLTMDPDYAGIVGFNKSELLQYFDDLINDVVRKTGKNREDILETMKCWHDGFQFCEKKESLYSPASVIGYLRSNCVTVNSYSDSAGSSQFIITKLKEFPRNALQFILDHGTHSRSDKKEERRQPILASRRELMGKMDFKKRGVKELVTHLFHIGYFSIRERDAKSDYFTLNFTNLELEQDYAERLADSLFETFPNRLINKIQLMVEDLNAYRWESFCEKLDSYNAEIAYQLTNNQKLQDAKEAWFHFMLFLMLVHAENHQRIMPTIEDSTYKGRADIAFTNGIAIYVFEPKLEENPENPVYECKEKYVQKYLFDSDKNVFCIGLKFTTQGSVASWGVSSFSYDGKLVGEEGLIKLTNQLSLKERKHINDNIINYVRKNPECTLKAERLSDFLEQLGPSMEDQLIFAEKFFENTPINSLYPVLSNVKPLVEEPNIKGILFSFLNEAKERKVNKTLEKPVKDDPNVLLIYSEVLEPARKLFKDKNVPISYPDFVRFIYQCKETKEAATIVSRFTEDIQSIYNLLEKCHPLIEDSLIKGRITRIRTALGKKLDRST